MDWPRRWRARLIWYRPPPRALDEWEMTREPSSDSFGFLRRSFDLPSVPARAPCRIAVDGRYVLFVNGTCVGRGPVRAEPPRMFFDVYDLAPLLVAGRNAVAVLARHYARPTVHWVPAGAAGEIGFGSLAFEAILGETHLGSDDGWRARIAPYDIHDDVADGPPAAEVLDGRAYPWGWTEAGFDDSGWARAVVLTPSSPSVLDPSPPAEPFQALEARSIAHLAERVIAAGTLELADGARATIDLGAIVAAHPTLEVRAAEGTAIELACGEDLGADGRPVTGPRNWTMRYTAAGVDGERVEAFEPVGFRYLEVGARGGRAGLRVSARERTYPRAPGASFSCSDPDLEAIWQAGARSLDLCSFDAFVDCPGREQRAWLGDAFLTTAISLVCNPDTRLARHTLLLHGRGARADGLLPMVAAGDFGMRATTIPDFSLMWILGVGRFWEHTGDGAFLEEALPAASRALAWFERHRGGEGLLEDLPGWIFIDWAQTERRAHIAAVDALHVMALDAFAALCEATGDAGSAARAGARASQTRRAFEKYWDAGRGAYVDAADAGGPCGRRMSQQTNAVAILSGCAPPERAPAILERILDEGRLVRTATPGDPGTFPERMNRQWMAPENFDDEENVVLAQPFFSHFVHQAVVGAGRIDLLLDLLRRWRPLVARGNGCLEEYWDAEPGLGSRAHVWSATPTYDLSAHVLGVRPGEPGYRSILVEPFLGDLGFAEGAVPTPNGFVHVRLERGGNRTIELPPGTTGTARVDGRDVPLREGRALL